MRLPKWYRDLWLRWAAVQFASIFCIMAAVMLLICMMVRSGTPGFWWPWGWAYAQLMVLFYGLHWRLQGICYRLDPTRSERVIALIKHQRSRYEPDF